jgi:ABC-type histidine transport system ATPase subunit
MHQGQIEADGSPDELFGGDKSERFRRFTAEVVR